MNDTLLQQKQNVHLTFKANKGVGRHDWLRLTPAYSVHLVKKELESLDPSLVILDPFSGTGTTGICAAENGHNAVLTDVNPFLIWLAETKSRNYSDKEISLAREFLNRIIERRDHFNYSTPPIHNIERWWSPAKLTALSQIRAGIKALNNGAASDLLYIGFCNTLIKVSNAAFNHQSVSFKKTLQIVLPNIIDEENEVYESFFNDVSKVIASAEIPLTGKVHVVHSDARDIKIPLKADRVITSPPYVNRMSYIRELRPYMYWMDFLQEARQAGELDWKAIGGTWGIATSNLNIWSDERKIPVKEIGATIGKISSAHDKNGPLLSKYVAKYFYDMWDHFVSIGKNLNKGAELVYIVGNSSFYGHIVPAEQWYGQLMSAVGFENVRIETIRKRNSNKALFEFAIRAIKP